MTTVIGKQRVVGWVLGKYCAKDLRYVLLDGHDAEVIRHDSVVSELNNQLEAQAAYSSMQFDRIAELTAEVASLREALVAIRVYANDTLSGPVNPDDDTRDWQRAAVIELRNRARNALKEGE